MLLFEEGAPMMIKSSKFKQNIVVSLFLIVLLIISGCSVSSRDVVQAAQEPTDALIIYVPPNLRFQVHHAILIDAYSVNQLLQLFKNDMRKVLFRLCFV